MSEIPRLMGVDASPPMAHKTHALSNQRLYPATNIDTSVDGPNHFVPGAANVDEMPLERYLGLAILLDLRGVARGLEPLAIDQVTAAGGGPDALAGRFAVLFTAWAENEPGGPRFHGHRPYLGTDTAAYLADNSVNALAVDFPIDNYPETPLSTKNDFPDHHLLLGHGIPLNEGLINLHQPAAEEFELWALPLKLKGGDSAGTHATARVG